MWIIGTEATLFTAGQNGNESAVEGLLGRGKTKKKHFSRAVYVALEKTIYGATRPGFVGRFLIVEQNLRKEKPRKRFWCAAATQA